ncbi:MAG: PAM68 family protein [Cyanobacteria bacterium P01_D01_bin.71]
MPADSDRERLPFEPSSKRKKGQKENSQEIADTSTKTVKTSQPVEASVRRSQTAREETTVPEVVGRRMLKRMLYFSGIPVALGVFIFFASYVLIIRGIAELPNVVVLLTTLACFGLSVVGLSYGALSASWEEDALGSLLGTEQFQVNFGRLVGSWQQAREERRNSSS